MGAAKGIVRRLPANKDLIYDYIPVDTVINELIVAAWHVGTTRYLNFMLSVPSHMLPHHLLHIAPPPTQTHTQMHIDTKTHSDANAHTILFHEGLCCGFNIVHFLCYCILYIIFSSNLLYCFYLLIIARTCCGLSCWPSSGSSLVFLKVVGCSCLLGQQLRPKRVVAITNK